MLELSEKTKAMLAKLTPEQRERAFKIVAEVAENRAKKALQAKAKLKAQAK